MQQFRDETGKDTSLQVLMQVISVGWPDNKKVVPLEVRAYFHCRDESSVQNGLIFKSDRVVVPTSLRADMIKKLHSSHSGIKESLRRAREAFYWQLMNSEIQDCIAKCSVCNTIKPEQCRETLMSHEVPSRPWVKIRTDLFTFKNQMGPHFRQRPTIFLAKV